MITWIHWPSHVQALEEVEANIVRLLALEEELRGTLKNGTQRTAEMEKIKWAWLWMSKGGLNCVEEQRGAEVCGGAKGCWSVWRSIRVLKCVEEQRGAEGCGWFVWLTSFGNATNFAPSHTLQHPFAPPYPQDFLQGWGTGSITENKSMRLYFTCLLNYNYQIHFLCERTAACTVRVVVKWLRCTTSLPSFTVILLHFRADVLARTEQTRKDYAAKKKEVLEKTQQVRTYIC